MKHIAVGGFFHESNTFNPIVTGVDDFIIFEGQEVYTKGVHYQQAQGIVDYFRGREDCHLIPLVFARAVPNGEVDGDLYQRLKERFFALLEDQPQPDIFVLALHGSMRVQGIGSAESDLLSEIRRRYLQTPIVSGMDMHATVNTRMLEYADAFVGYKTAPHIDAWETGQHAARMADMILTHGIKLTMAAVKLPYLIAGEKSETDTQPMQGLIDELRAVESREGVCAASYLLGFPWADAQENGVTALVVTDNDQELADELAGQLAERFEEVKDGFGFSSPAYPPEQALRLALQDDCKPVFVSDSGDNPTAGSTGDNTTIIQLLSGELKHLSESKKVLLAGIYDDAAYAICKESQGRTITLKVGGRYDSKYTQPIELTGKVMKHVQSFGPFASGLVLFATDAFELIITSRHIGFTGVDMFQALDIDYLDKDVIVVKLGYLTPDFKEIAAKSYLALSRGCTDEVLSRLDYSASYELL
ncbi:MAG: M81 family metallopeptidase [Candidatus Cloacimonetes bacterium]|nr:M81 family metallopeptidase [Candidatus Cloacimonadota bacterium]